MNLEIKQTTYSRAIFLCSLLLCLATRLISQPYVDPFQLRYMQGFRSPDSPATPFSQFWLGSDLPLKLKANTYLVFSPAFERWQIDSADAGKIYPRVQGFYIPVALVLPVFDTTWSISLVAIPRWNGEKIFSESTFQFGGALVASFTNKPLQKFKLGVYANAEFFGLFVIPLIGVDWRINERNRVFGILPGRMTIEHQWSAHVFGGINFRSLTNSYRFANGEYLRLGDNQISVFLDYYFGDHICVTLEPGYGILRKIRTGIEKKNYLTEADWGDGGFLKISASYRIRL